MAEATATRLWAKRTLFLALGILVIFFRLLPLETVPRSWAAPDILTALVLAWAARRPEYVPPVLIAAIMLLADLMFHRPPGLWAVLVLLASEAIKPRDRSALAANFTVEWLRFAAFVIAITVAYRLILAILLSSPGPLILSLSQTAGTIAIYPLVVLVSWALFGIRRPSPGDIDAMGFRT